jgi:hypothetical protein
MSDDNATLRKEIESLKGKVENLLRGGVNFSGQGFKIGKTRIYQDTSGNLYQREDDGTETDLAAAGGGVAIDVIWDAKGDLAVGTGANTAARLAVGANAHILTADSTAATGLKWATPAAAAAHNLLDGSAHPDTVAGNVAEDDIVVGNSTPKWSRLAIAAQTLIGRITGGHLVGLTAGQVRTLINVADGADVTAANDPKAHKTSHQDAGADEISVGGLSGLLADDQHVLDTEVVAAIEAHDPLSFGGDANFYVTMLGGAVPGIVFATNDYLGYNRTDNRLTFYIGGSGYWSIGPEGIIYAKPVAFYSSELTIAAGVITVTRTHHIVDTQADAATDDLDTITLTTAVTGNILILQPANAARDVVVKHNTGNILLADGLDYTMDDVSDILFLVYDAAVSAWRELTRSARPIERRIVFAIGDADTTGQKIGSPILPACGVTNIEVRLDKGQTCGATSLIVDIHKIPSADKDTDTAGTTIYSTQGNRPTIANTHMYADAAQPDVTAVAAGDILVPFIDQAGTTVTACTVTITVNLS